jgi:hypothetical protein
VLAPPPFCGAQCPTFFTTCPFQLIFSCLGFFYAEQGSICPGGYSGLSQGWLWKYHVPFICSLVGLRFPSRLGAGIWQPGSPLGFSIYGGMGKLCVGWGFGGVRVLPFLDGFSCQVCLQHLSRIFALRSSHYLLPSSSHHIGNSPAPCFNTLPNCSYLN